MPSLFVSTSVAPAAPVNVDTNTTVKDGFSKSGIITTSIPFASKVPVTIVARSTNPGLEPPGSLSILKIHPVNPALGVPFSSNETIAGSPPTGLGSNSLITCPKDKLVIKIVTNKM